MLSKADLGPYSPTILKGVLSLLLHIFLYLEAFEYNTISDWPTVWFSQSEVVLHLDLQNLERKRKNVLENGW